MYHNTERYLLLLSIHLDCDIIQQPETKSCVEFCAHWTTKQCDGLLFPHCKLESPIQLARACSVALIVGMCCKMVKLDLTIPIRRVKILVD